MNKRPIFCFLLLHESEGLPLCSPLVKRHHCLAKPETQVGVFDAKEMSTNYRPETEAHTGRKLKQSHSQGAEAGRWQAGRGKKRLGKERVSVAEISMGSAGLCFTMPAGSQLSGSQRGGTGGGPPAGCPCPLVIKRAFLLTPSGTLRGSWAQKPFSVPISLITGNRLHSTCLTFSEFQQAGSNSCSSRKGSVVEMREKHKKKQ